jgi:hypothetical protein
MNDVDLTSGWIRGTSNTNNCFSHPEYSLKTIIESAESSIPPSDLYIKHYDPDTLEITHCLTLKEAKRLLKVNSL